MDNNKNQSLDKKYSELVSVIIPNYNKGPFLEECLNSVISQGEIIKEIIVVDDHSDDGSWLILQDYRDEFDHLKIYKNPNKGAQSARNFGFAKSSGKFIQWLDSDDILGQLKIAEQVKSLDHRSPRSIGFCGWCHFSKSLDECTPFKSIILKDYENPTTWLADAWHSGSMLVPACWLVPRVICEEVKWDESVLKNQDGVYFFDVLMRSVELVYTSSVLVYYRRPGKNNVSQQKSEEHIRSLLGTLQHYEIILERLENQTIRNALASNYLNFIYSISPEFNSLQREAYQCVKRLNVLKLPLVGGAKFRVMQSLMGFKLALIIKKLNTY